MIKLILTPKTQPICYTFEQNYITIGGVSSENIQSEELEKTVQPDLPLALPNVQPLHLSIEYIDGKYIAINRTNDPFTTINQLPFRKKILAPGDYIEIYSATLLFEGAGPLSNPIPTAQTNEIEINKNQQQTEKFAINSCLITPPADLHIDKIDDFAVMLANLAQFDEDNDDVIDHQLLSHNIDDLLKRVEELESALIETNTFHKKIKDKPDTTALKNVELSRSEQTEESRPIITKLSEAESNFSLSEAESNFSLNDVTEIELAERNIYRDPSTARKSLKDDYLRDLDDENEGDQLLNKSSSGFNPRLVIRWKTFAIFLIGLMFFFCAAFAIFYVSITDRSEKEEIKVAVAVSDVVMALNFAQLNHALAKNQNWSDPDFLKHNLAAVLANGFAPLANVDSHGQFTGTSYILRIYTSNDLEHFLVIAQPHPNLLQWLAPKSAIIVDSQLMELRKTNDLKTLNRLLVDATLDSSNTGEIAHLVGQGQLIALEELNQIVKNNSFNTPKALAFLRPGSENLIYNALRYYHFGETLTKKAIAIYESRDNHAEAAQVFEEINALQKFKNIVLYTSGGLQTALAAQKAIATLMPQHKFLFGYLQFNSQGLAFGSHLLIDDNTNEIAALTSDRENDSPQLLSAEGYHPWPLTSPKTARNEHLDALDNLLPELYQERHSALKMIEKEIQEMLDSENYHAVPNFSKKLQQLHQEFDLIVEKYNTNVIRTLSLISTATLETKASEIENEQDNTSVFFEEIFPEELLLEEIELLTDEELKSYLDEFHNALS